MKGHSDTDTGQVDTLLEALYANTQMADLDVRLALFEATPATLAARHDRLLDLAAALRVLGEANEQRDLAETGAMIRLRPALIAAERAMRNGRLAPDANGTLRVGFGVVQGYAPRDGVFYQPQTTIAGVLAKNTGMRPFDSPPALLDLARQRRFGPYVDPDLGTLPVGFVCTVNVTNGSSGSAALNAWGEIAGLAFDVNWEGIAADWVVNTALIAAGYKPVNLSAVMNGANVGGERTSNGSNPSSNLSDQAHGAWQALRHPPGPQRPVLQPPMAGRGQGHQSLLSQRSG